MADPASSARASVDDLLTRWQARPDGAVFTTATSVLAPARRAGVPVMIKIATDAEEERGNALMSWWNGRGSARVLERDGVAILLERATGPRSLTAMAGPDASQRSDEDATRVLCATGMRLHAAAGMLTHTPTGLPDLVPLERWFDGLFAHAAEAGGFHARAAGIALDLLRNQREVTVLHGDLHHGNVLDFGARRHPEDQGWAAIDPKGLIGDRAFDFANILCNPSADVALRPGRVARAVDVIAAVTGLTHARLLRWGLVWGALSSAWSIRAGQDGHGAMGVGREAERLLNAG